MLSAGIRVVECLEFRVFWTRQSSCWGSAAKWLRIGGGMLQVHKELGSLCLLIVSFPLHFPGSFFLPRTTLNSSMTSLGPSRFSPSHDHVRHIHNSNMQASCSL